MSAVLQSHLPVFDSKSEAPPLFNGATRLYISLTCPFAQRVWAAKNYKGLDNIELVAINLADKPSWYKEKVYPVGKVPSLEHNGQVTGESLDLLDFLEKHFEGPSLVPKDLDKQEVVNELLNYTDTFTKAVFTTLRAAEPTKENLDEAGSVLDYLETALGKYADQGPYLVGELSKADFAYIPFVERAQLLFSAWLNYDITEGRPKLSSWIKALNEVEGYAKTKADPQGLVEEYTKHFGKK